MKRRDAQKAFDIYRRARKQAERLLEFYELCRSLDVEHGERYATIEQVVPWIIFTINGPVLKFFARICYQLDSLEMTIKQNAIVFLETGFCKTLIAIMLLRGYAHLLRKPSISLAVFLVHTVVLVSQQAEVVEMHTDLMVGKYWGEMGVEFWNASDWKKQQDEFEPRHTDMLHVVQPHKLHIIRYCISAIPTSCPYSFRVCSLQLTPASSSHLHYNQAQDLIKWQKEESKPSPQLTFFTFLYFTIQRIFSSSSGT
ncbi:hypothetical protein POM88_045164 [Heracleum sosnowskyi]|uniref:AP180 N-terminal homology (ANTH) domain-containing protein n=1 Tax=Heracleum sosnowskyi TaxID=360622 RepID=A0AAD8M3J3_9APIA|nr:hypothetical protein POM88_045164 [Heracleum sosnowskyi]